MTTTDSKCLRNKIATALCFLVASFHSVSALSILNNNNNNERAPSSISLPPIRTAATSKVVEQWKENTYDNRFDVQRRHMLASSFGLATAVMTSCPNEAMAASDTAITPPTTAMESMKSFVDPLGLFTLNLPTRFYTVRRTAKGDLPDEKTGKGRRGSSIFTAGDLSKAEVIAIERFPTRILLEENGIDVTGSNLSTFPDIGDPAAIANLITVRREKERSGTINTSLLRDSVKVTPDGKELYFSLISSIAVQKPELLLEQTGVSELVRITLAKASLRSNDGNLLTIFASALETDFKGPDGTALKEAVQSFQALEPPR